MRRGRNYKLVGRRKQLFLEALAARGNVTAAAHAAGVSRACAYLNRQNDDTFAKAWEEAEEIAADRLEAEAWRRGVEGVEEPVISLGKVVEGVLQPLPKLFADINLDGVALPVLLRSMGPQQCQ